jgi:hypothetical protein
MTTACTNLSRRVHWSLGSCMLCTELGALRPRFPCQGDGCSALHILATDILSKSLQILCTNPQCPPIFHGWQLALTNPLLHGSCRDLKELRDFIRGIEHANRCRLGQDRTFTSFSRCHNEHTSSHDALGAYSVVFCSGVNAGQYTLVQISSSILELYGWIFCRIACKRCYHIYLHNYRIVVS